MMDNDVIKVLVENIDDLPSLPLVVQKILEVINRDNSSVKDLADSISMEPSLTTKVLKLVNSSFYGMNATIKTVTHAISLLGFNEIKSMVLGIKVFEAFGGVSKDSPLHRIAFWEHSLACGIFARALAKRLGRGLEEEAFIGGLLHDIGKILIDEFFPREFKEIAQRAQAKEMDIWALEKEMIGTSHTEVGAWLAEFWKLPESYRSCIRFHHLNPSLDSMKSDEDLSLAFLVKSSDFFVRLFDIGFSCNPWLQIPPKALWESLGIGQSDFEKIYLTLQDKLEETKRAFGLEEVGSGFHGQGEKELERMGDINILISGLTSRPVDPLKMVLKCSDLVWEETSVGRDLIEKVKSTRPGLVILDFLGYKVNGDQLLPLFRALKKTTAAPLVILGKNCLKEEQAQSLGMGPILRFSKMPGRMRLIQEVSKMLSSG